MRIPNNNAEIRRMATARAVSRECPQRLTGQPRSATQADPLLGFRSLRKEPASAIDASITLALAVKLPLPRTWTGSMCRNIKTLFNFDPPVTDEEIRDASLQFVRKLSGFTKPSQANEAAFQRAVDQTAEVARRLLHSLITTAAPRDREVEAAKKRAKAAVRFGSG